MNTGGGEVVDAPVGSEAGQAEWVSGTLKPGKADAVLPNRWGAGYEKRNRSHTRTHTPRIPVGGSCGAAPVRSEAGQTKWVCGALKSGLGLTRHKHTTSEYRWGGVVHAPVGSEAGQAKWIGGALKPG